MRAALASRDVTAVYRLLTQVGVTQRVIAAATGQSQSEVSNIVVGRQVLAYDVLVRICEGLSIPRGYMGLGYDGNLAMEETSEDVKRRGLLAAGSIALLGAPVLGEVLHIPVRPDVPTPLPSRLGTADVTALRNLTATLRTGARAFGGGADVLTGVAHRSLPLMSVPASEATRSALGSALAELHTMAGWVCVDSGYHDQARAHFAKAMELASEARDGNEVASAFRHAGLQMIDSGAFNDGLKAYQLGLACPWDTDADNVAWLTAVSALPFAAMGRTDAALTAVKTAREHELADPFDNADMEYVTACVYRRLNRLDIAESCAATSLRKWSVEGRSARDSVRATLIMAELHAAAGEPDGAALAHRAIEQVAGLRSRRAKDHLGRLADALDTRPGADHRDLARRARQVAFLT